jgi:RNA polymerase sigma-70 factor (ECF subfamily)
MNCLLTLAEACGRIRTMTSAPLSEFLLGSPERAAQGSPALEALLADIVQTAATTWPKVKLGAAEFVAYLGQRLPPEQPPEEALRQLHTADLYLACACARGDTHALAAFETYGLGVIDGALATLRIDDHVIAEVKQQLRRDLLVGDPGPPSIVDFVGRGHLRGWVRVVAVRAALTQVRRAQRDRPVDDELLESKLGPHHDPELEFLKHQYRGEFNSALQEAIRDLPVRDRTLLRQQFLDGLTIDEIGLLNQVHRATAARWLVCARQRVLARTRATLMKRLTLESQEFDSLLRLIHSRLDVSLRAFFRRR